MSNKSNFYMSQKDDYGYDECLFRMTDWMTIERESIKKAKSGMCLNRIADDYYRELYWILESIQEIKKPLLKIMPLKLYRCVNYEKRKPIEFSNLTSPPDDKTKDLRMSKKGDSVFYGSLQKETALHEAQSSENSSYTYISLFESIHDLCVLDLTCLKPKDSFETTLERRIIAFLLSFSKSISRPIDDDIINYTPTQLITFYFRNCLKLYHKDGGKRNLDGILYFSSKCDDTNAVLFYDNSTSKNHLKLLECYEIQGSEIKEHFVFN